MVLSFDIDEALTFRLPKDQEQKRSASFLSSHYYQIIVKNQKHENLKAHKNGLMPQLSRRRRRSLIYEQGTHSSDAEPV